MIHKALSVLFLSAVWINSAAASDASAKDDAVYAAITGLYSSAKIGSYRFAQMGVQAAAGYYFHRQMSAELLFATGLTEDTKKTLTAELDYVLGIKMRFESPEQHNTKAFMSLGYASTAISMKKGDSAFPGDGSFESPLVGIGFEVVPNSLGGISYIAEYTHYYLKDDVSIGGANLGVKYAF